MPLLSFQIQADYDKVIRLRNEIEKLKSEMRSVNAVFDADRFNSYNKRLKEATTEFNALVDGAAKAGAKVNSSVQAMSRTVDLSNPSKELKKFDGQVEDLCKHLNAYFDFLKGKLQDTLTMLNEVGSIADKVKIGNENAGQLEELKRQNAELTSEIQRQIAAYGEQQSQFQALANAVRSNNIPALQQFTQQEDEASKRLKLDEARNSLKGVTDDMKSLAAQMAEAQGDVERLESLLDSLKNSYLDDGNAIKDSQYLETEQALESAREKLVGMKKEYNEMAILQKQYSDQVQQTNGHQERLRTQIMNAREDMVKLIAAGQAGTPTFNEIVSQTGKMRRELALANAYMQYFADPDRNLATLKQSMEGAAGGASLLVGVMGLFNQKSEEMEMIQTKLQSLLGIIVGLETTYAAVKKTSNVMIAIGQIQSWASAKAKAAETVATEAGTVATIKATAAQAMFNTVAKANPYLALLSIITLVVGGIYTLAKALGSETDEQKKAAEAAKEHAEEIRKQHEAWAHSVANSAAKQIMSYKNLQKKWEELGNDLKAKEKFVTDNKTAFNDLGFSVDNVTQAENLLIKNTDAVVNAIMARAKAAAYEKVATEELERQIRIELEKGTVANGAYRKNFKKGQRLSLDEARELERESGVSLVGANSKSTKGVAFSTDVEVTNENVLNNAAKKAAENRRKRYLADRTKRIQESKDKVKLIQENARQEYEAEKAAVEQTGVPQFTPTKTTSRNGGNTSDRLHAIMDKQKLDEQRRAIDLEFSTREAQIKAMQDGTDRVLAQIELDREREEEAIRRSYEDMRLKRIEEARKVWEADPKNKGKNFYDTQEYAQANTNTQEETDNRDARMKAAKADYKKALEEQRDMQVQSLRDYLKEYGSIQDQKRAIAEEYDRKIAKASDEIQKALLRKQKENLLRELNMKEFQSSINWEVVFSNFDRLSTEALQTLRDKLRNMLRDGNITPENAKVLSEKILEAENEIANRKDVFANLFPALKERLRITNQIKQAEEEIQMLQNSANQKRTELVTLISGKANMSEGAFRQQFGSELAADDFESILSSLGIALDDTTEEGKALTIALANLKKSVEQVTVAQENKETIRSMLKGDKSLFGGIGDIMSNAVKAGGGGLLGIIDVVGTNLNSMADFSDKIGLAGTDFGDAVHGFADGVNGFQSAIGALAKGDIFGAVNGVLDGIAGFGRAGISLFAGGGNADEMEAEIARLSAVNDKLAQSIDSLASKISQSDATNKQSVEAYRRALDAEKEWEANQRRAIDDRASEWSNSGHGFLGLSGKHSFNSYLNDRGSGWRGWRDFNNVLQQNGYSTRVNSAGDLWQLSPEMMKLLRDYAPSAWIELLNTDGESNPSDLINQYIERAGKIEELTSALNEKLTGYSWEGYLDKYKSLLKDLTSETEDFGDAIEEIISNALLESLVNDEFKDRIKNLYKYIADHADDGLDEGELNYIRNENEKIANDMIARRQNLVDAGMIKPSEDEKEQKATANGIEKMTHEDAGVIEGRLTATQIAVEQGNTKKDAILSQATMMNVTMSDIRSIATAQSEIADDTRNILANSYLELREANDHLGKIEKAVGNIQTIAEDTKKIVDDRL